MDNPNLKLNLAGFREIRQDPRVKAELMRRGQQIAEACGPGYVAEPAHTVNRARVIVYAETSQAIHDEAVNNNLIKNMDAARK